MKTIAPLALGFALALAASAQAQAHAKLVSADPPVGGVAKAQPQNLDLLFSEKISEKLSGASVKDAGGKAIPAMTMTEKAGAGLMVMLKQPLKPGVYSVTWHAVASDDGHRTEGTYSFTVN
jgi:hypothetical protein